MMDDRIDRELNEDGAIARVKSALAGDYGAVAAMDAMERAEADLQSRQLSPAAWVLIGTIVRRTTEGESLAGIYPDILGNCDEAHWHAAIDWIDRDSRRGDTP